VVCRNAQQQQQQKKQQQQRLQADTPATEDPNKKQTQQATNTRIHNPAQRPNSTLSIPHCAFISFEVDLCLCACARVRVRVG
jgi:sRNA-binding protein